MRLILVRHGNTFGPGDEATWVGAQNDIPLVARGLEQANEIGAAFKAQGVMPAAIYTSPLQRTQQTATIICEHISPESQPIIEKSLIELDYGLWSGLSNKVIAENYGEDELQAWDKQSIWPQHANWGSSESEVCSQVNAFVAMLKTKHQADDTIILVSSNGVLRYFLKLIPNEFASRVAQQSFKMKTGYCSVLEIGASTKVVSWNCSASL